MNNSVESFIALKYPHMYADLISKYNEYIQGVKNTTNADDMAMINPIIKVMDDTKGSVLNLMNNHELVDCPVIDALFGIITLEWEWVLNMHSQTPVFLEMVFYVGINDYTIQMKIFDKVNIREENEYKDLDVSYMPERIQEINKYLNNALCFKQ